MIVAQLPGAELIEQRRADLTAGLVTIESLLLSIAAPGLRDLGLAVGQAILDADWQRYALLDQARRSGRAQQIQRIDTACDELPPRRAVHEVVDRERARAVSALRFRDAGSCKD